MRSGTDLGPELGARLGYLLKHAFLALEELHADHLAGTGVNARELTVLQLLGSHEPQSQQHAAGRLGVDRTTMVGLLDALEDKGLVARQADAKDRRRNVVVLTASGRRTLTEATAASDEAERRLLEPLTTAEATQLRELLRRVSTAPVRPLP